MYRQFHDRESLDRCIRTEISTRVHQDLDTALLAPERKTPLVIIRELVEVLLTWESTHSNLLGFLRSGPTVGGQALDGMYWLRTQLAERSSLAVLALAASIGMTNIKEAATSIHAAVAMVEGAIRYWLESPTPDLTRAEIITLVTEYAWVMIDRLATTYGLDLDPQRSVSASLQALGESLQAR